MFEKIATILMILISGIFVLLGFGGIILAFLFFRMGVQYILEARELRFQGPAMNIFVAIFIALGSISMGTLGALVIGIAID